MNAVFLAAIYVKGKTEKIHIGGANKFFSIIGEWLENCRINFIVKIESYLE